MPCLLLSLQQYCVMMKVVECLQEGGCNDILLAGGVYCELYTAVYCYSRPQLASDGTRFMGRLMNVRECDMFRTTQHDQEYIARGQDWLTITSL